jgi:hypothetical protein
MDWLRGSYEQLEFKDGKKADQDMGKHLVAGKRKGALWIFDLGFWDLEFFSALALAGSYYLSRLQSQVAVWVKDHTGEIKRFDLDKFLCEAPRTESFEMEAYLGAKQQLPCRLICIPMPSAIAKRRKRQAQAKARRKGRKLTHRALNRLSWGLFVTNASMLLLPTTVVDSVYRVRWQIELVFKLAKSGAALEKTNSQNKERVLCEIYAKLIALLFFKRLVAWVPHNNNQPLSYPKAWKRLADKVESWGKALRQRNGLTELISITDYLARRAKTSRKQKYPSTGKRLDQVAKQSQICCLTDPIEYMRTPKKRKSRFFQHSTANNQEVAA